MAKKILCWCKGDPACKLCGGTKVYEYTPGERGWMPFVCPTCSRRRVLDAAEGGEARSCPTCQGQGRIDPANAPRHGLFDMVFKAIFGA
jgi:hypothetical protein